MAITWRLRWCAFAGGLLCVIAGGAFGDPGFGTIRKRRIDLSIRQPAAVRLANTSFAVTGSSTSPSYLPVQESLTTTLETELLSNEHTLVKKPAGEAAWVLGLRVTGFSLPPPQQSTQTVGNQTVTFVQWAGSLHAAYQVLDHGGGVYDAGNVDYTYGQELSGATSGSSVLGVIPGLKKRAPPSEVPHTEEDVKQILIRELVKQIATKLGNTRQILEVQVAAGDDHLNRAADFMQQRLWSRAQEELEKMPEFPKPDKEAYRQYDLGLAYEAMSYDASTFNDQRENLFKAEEYYDKALEMNQKEKYFVEAVARTKDAISRYKALESMQKEDRNKQAALTAVAQNEAPKVPVPSTQLAAQVTTQPAQTGIQPAAQSASPVRSPSSVPSQATKPPTSKRQAAVQPAAQPGTPAAKASALPVQAPAAKPPATKAATAKALTVNDVIDMFSSGVPLDQIVAIIQRAQVQFDPYDKDTAISVAKAKLPVNIQNEMRKKVGAPLLPVQVPTPAPSNPAKK